MTNRVARRAIATKKSAPIGGPGAPVPAGTEVTVTQAPSFFASGLALAWVGNEIILSFTRHIVGHATVAGEPMQVAQGMSVADISISPMTLKDMVVVLTSAVEAYEKEFGEIQTSFTRQRASENAS